MSLMKDLPFDEVHIYYSYVQHKLAKVFITDFHRNLFCILGSSEIINVLKSK